MSDPIKIVHLIYALRIGGMENILVTLINRLPDTISHTVICLSGADQTMIDRIQRKDVRVICLEKPPGRNLTYLGRLWKHLMEIKPDIFQTYNLGPLEGQWAAAAAGVRCRLHCDHGRDVHDLEGTNRKYNLLRRLTDPVIHHYLTVSQELRNWLVETISVRPEKITQIYTGIDVSHFVDADGAAIPDAPDGFFLPQNTILTTVGRLAEVKAQNLLIEAFHQLRSTRPDGGHLRLMIVGDGPLKQPLLQQAERLQLDKSIWLTGGRTDISKLLKASDIFAIPSLTEAVSIAVLEAMAAGKPVVATRVGGNAELVREGETGFLVPSGDAAALAASIGMYLDRPELKDEHGRNGQSVVRREFTVEFMLERYRDLYWMLSQRYS